MASWFAAIFPSQSTMEICAPNPLDFKPEKYTLRDPFMCFLITLPFRISKWIFIFIWLINQISAVEYWHVRIVRMNGEDFGWVPVVLNININLNEDYYYFTNSYTYVTESKFLNFPKKTFPQGNVMMCKFLAVIKQEIWAFVFKPQDSSFPQLHQTKETQLRRKMWTWAMAAMVTSHEIKLLHTSTSKNSHAFQFYCHFIIIIT